MGKELIKTETVTRNTYLEYSFNVVPTGSPAPSPNAGFTDIDLVATNIEGFDIYLQNKVTIEIV